MRALVFSLLLGPTQGFLTELPRQRQGPYEVTLLLPPSGLYAEEEMEIEFRVVEPDATGPDGGPRPVARARIHAEASMPSMPSMAKFEELAHPEGIPGVFGVHPVFPHGGDYRLCLTILPSEFRRAGDPGPEGPVTFEFPLVVEDATRSPTPAARRVRPFVLDVATTPSRPVAGERVEIHLSVRMASSFEKREVTNFEVQHEKLMHLFLVRDDLAVFAHEHPEPSGPGAFRLRYRVPAPGRYRVFADVAPLDAGSQVLSSTIEVGGAASGRSAPAPAVATTRVALALPEDGLSAGRTAIVEAILTDSEGQPVRDLQPWLGAMAHGILVHEDAETCAHAHPDEREPGVGIAGRVPFLVRLPRPGRYKGWVQFQRGGRVETVEIEVAATPD